MDFDPGLPVDPRTSNGLNSDAFVSWFDMNRTYLGVHTWGDTMSDSCRGISIDSSDSIIITGYFGGSVDFDPSPGIAEITAIDADDIFIVKFDSNTLFEWVRGFGSIWYDDGFDVITDDSDNIFGCGSFYNTVDFDPDIWSQDWHASNGHADAFLLKLLPNGEWQ